MAYEEDGLTAAPISPPASPKRRWPAPRPWTGPSGGLHRRCDGPGSEAWPCCSASTGKARTTGAPLGRAGSAAAGVWVLGALGLAGLAFTSGFSGFIDRTEPTIDVTARRGGVGVRPIRPATWPTPCTHRPVQLTLSADDGCPCPALRVKPNLRRAGPALTRAGNFEADQPGTYILRSNVFSGDESTATASSRSCDEVSDIFIGRTMAEVGELLADRAAVRSMAASSSAPASETSTATNSTPWPVSGLIADEAYIRESILEPVASTPSAGDQPSWFPTPACRRPRHRRPDRLGLKTLSRKGGPTTQEEN